MSETTNLKLPYLAAAQSQKHVTHNEALRALDAVVQLSVLDRDAGSPPAAPAEGDRYIVASPASGGWTGQAGKIAAWQDGAWIFYPPAEGWLAWIADEGKLAVREAGSWSLVPSGSGGSGGATNLSIANRTGTALDVASDTGTDATVPAATTVHAGLITSADKTKLDGITAGADVTPAALQLRSMVGINATADATNRLSLKSPASLFDNEGGGHQHKINKAAAADTASLLYQTGYSGRAELGTSGDDDFHVKVSADGSTWREALTIDRSTGSVAFPQALKLDTADVLGLTEATSINNSADFLLLQTSGGLRRKVKPANLGLGGAGGGEANSASNVGTAGVGLFKVKSGVDLQFRKINAGSSRITVTLDGANDEVDIDLGTLAIADVTGLQAALDGKAAAAHTHTASQISDATAAGRALLTAATAAAQKTALALIQADVGLSNADNTSDLAKPVSTATQAALDGKSAVSHVHDTSGLADGAVTYAKIQNVSAPGRLIARKSSGAGAPEECSLTDVLDFVGSAAQGDILYRTASGWTRLPAGAAGQFLKTLGSGADPAWDTPPAGGGGSSNFAESPPSHSPAFGALASNALRGLQSGALSLGTSAPTANRLYLCKVHFEKARTLTGLGIRVSTAGAAGTRCRLGIYEMSENGLPTTLLLDAGTVATDTTGYKEISISQAVAKRPYYLAAVFDGTPSVNVASTLSPFAGVSSGTGTAVAYLFRAFTMAALPADETSQAGTYTAGGNNAPALFWI